MLKITSIVSSLIFLFFIGTGSYARATANQNRKAASKIQDQKENKEDTSEEDLDGKPSESVNRLDLFQAFSLVNAQLKWKDFHGDLRSKYRRKNVQKAHLLEISENTQGWSIAPQSVSDLPKIQQQPTFVLELNEETSSIVINHNATLQAKTIDFILNCGTYPHACS